jgi:beta-N-acetylhexosaminidase
MYGRPAVFWLERAIAVLASMLASASGIVAAAVVAGGATVDFNKLSRAQLAGQRVIYSYSGLTPPASLLAKIRAGEAAGVIFFDANIASRAQIKRVAAELQAAAKQSPVKLPLLDDRPGGGQGPAPVWRAHAV